jgi:alkylation response protein AidB-like acyl-CoA dehydrogenase
MDVCYPPDVLAFGATVRTWLHDNLPAGWFEPGFTLGPDERAAFLADWFPRLRAARWICASWPEEYGGRGLGLLESVVLAEEFARADAPMRVSSLGEILVGPTILQWGTDEQKARFLPEILAGASVWCQGFSEPGAGSDLAGVATRAERSADGTAWIVTGEKIWTSEAEDADFMILLARTDPTSLRHAGISYLLMPMRVPGISFFPIAQIDGTAGFNRVVFDGAPCPVDNVVGPVDGGWKVAMSTLGFERGASTAASYHRFRRDLDGILAAAATSGRAAHPLVRQRLMRTWIDVELMRINGYRTLTGLLHGRTDSGLAALETTFKVAWSEHDQRAMRLAVDLLGADGMVLTGTEDDVRHPAVGLGRRVPVHRYPASPLQQSFLFALSETIYGGTSEIQRNVVAERVLGLPRDPR